LQVTSEVLTADRIASALLPYQYLATILAAMTEEQKRLILPNTALVDYVQLQNFAGYTVPPNSLGQKDGVLYFGDSPLQAGSSKQVIDVYALVNNTLAGPNRWNRSLGTFDVAPGEFLANNFFLLEFDLHFLFSSGEAPASNEAALFASLVFDNELVDIEVTLAGALMVDICPFVAGRERVTLRGSWLLQGAGGGLSGGGSSLLKTDLNSATLASTSRLLQFFSEDGMGYGSGPANPSAPDHLNLVVMPVLGAIPASGIVVSGRVSFGPAAVS
jgi:hypothetical protein